MTAIINRHNTVVQRYFFSSLKTRSWIFHPPLPLFCLLLLFIHSFLLHGFSFSFSFSSLFFFFLQLERLDKSNKPCQLESPSTTSRFFSRISLRRGILDTRAREREIIFSMVDSTSRGKKIWYFFKRFFYMLEDKRKGNLFCLRYCESFLFAIRLNFENYKSNSIKFPLLISSREIFRHPLHLFLFLPANRTLSSLFLLFVQPLASLLLVSYRTFRLKYGQVVWNLFIRLQRAWPAQLSGSICSVLFRGKDIEDVYVPKRNSFSRLFSPALRGNRKLHVSTKLSIYRAFWDRFLFR